MPFFRSLMLSLLVISALLPLPAAFAASPARCFPETGQCISGAIRTFWERNGGLSVFGFPISDLRTEANNDGWTGSVQWFERDRLEDHSGCHSSGCTGSPSLLMMQISRRI